MGKNDANRTGSTSQRCGNLPVVSFSEPFYPKAEPPAPLDEDGLVARVASRGFPDAETPQARYLMERIGYTHASEYFGEYARQGAGLMSIHQAILLDRRFQSVIFEYIGLFELQFRAQYSYLMSNECGTFAHRYPENFKSQEFYQSFKADYGRELKRQLRAHNSKVTTQVETYGDLPIWQAVEIMSFGTLSKIYKNTRSKSVRMGVADSFGVRYAELESCMQTISYVRNRCVHFGKVLGTKLVYMPKRLRGVTLNATSPFYVVLILERLLSSKTDFQDDPSLMYSVSLAGEMASVVRSVPWPIASHYMPANWASLITRGRHHRDDHGARPGPMEERAGPPHLMHDAIGRDSS